MQEQFACTYPVQHADDVFCVCEGADLLEALAIDYRKRLQAQALHHDFGCEQKAVVEFIEELVSTSAQKEGGQSFLMELLLKNYIFVARLKSYDLLMAFDSSFSSSSSSRRR